ncbi:MAG: hypothetical protein BEN19_08155 [Epulopiscium sp. Nuni2H_MBin003]|nr:MAG: hypothetical protein BEN19_08155 [Epulopiscium sp. Nuni2H_MBin003]
MKNLMARNKISALFDANSFVEIGALIKSKSTAFSLSSEDTLTDGVVCGYGTVGGKLVYACAQDESIMNGALGEMHTRKIIKTYDEAKKVGAPVVMFLCTTGVRLEEGVDTLEWYGKLYKTMAKAKGVVPQITIVCGKAQGGVAILCGMSDFVFMDSKNAKVFLASTNTMEDKNAKLDDIQTSSVHASKSGLAQFAGDEAYITAHVKELISIIPSNYLDSNYVECSDDLNRVDASLNNFDFVTQDVTKIITSIADNNKYIAISEEFGKSVTTGFIKLNGATIGVIANADKGICIEGIKKSNKILQFCKSFNLPILTLVNVTHFASSIDSEQNGIIEQFSEFVLKVATAEIPKVSVILNDAFGTPYVIMNSGHIGADVVYAWPTANISLMPTDSAIKIMYSEELASGTVSQEKLNELVQEYNAQNSGVNGVASRGYIDDIIEPGATRKRLIAAFEMLYTKGYNKR